MSGYGDFRERMQVPVSNAEQDVLIELATRNLHPESQQRICLYSCKPDFYFPDLKLCIFIDGPPHQKARRIDRDNGIDELLRKRGFKVARFSYKNSLSQQRLGEIVDAIEATVKEA